MSADAPDLPVPEAVRRWLGRIRLDRADQTVASYRRRLSHFVAWCEQQGIETVAELTPWLLDEFDTHRRSQNIKPISLQNELSTLRLFLEYCGRVGLADPALADAIETPSVPEGDETDDSFLAPERAAALLSAYRTGDERYSREHAALELAWWTGARKGGLLALDLGDFDPAEGYVRFRHRPETGTPLKNGAESERVVGLGAPTISAVAGYITHSRPQVLDEHGRSPLFATVHGRAHLNTLSKSMYFGTVPCRHRPCPHGRERPGCRFYSRSNGIECPSATSPHPVRSGSIMWQLNRGLRPDRVADRVDATMETIDMFYDKTTQLEAFRKRRAADLKKLGFEADEVDGS